MSQAHHMSQPVAWINSKELSAMRGNADAGAKNWRVNLGLVKEEGDVALFTCPSQRTWVGLSMDELTELFYNLSLGQQSAVQQAIALLEERNI